MLRLWIFATLLIAAAARADGFGEAEALSWLAIVDDERYEESWPLTAPLFQAQVGQADWVTAASRARAPFGEVKSRSLVMRSEQESLPGVPDGNYVVLVYSTEFDAKAEAQETITLSLTDGAWRVLGYFIK